MIDHVIESLRTGAYAPGQRLIEADLVDQLHVSRTIVREALRWLAAAGFIELEPNRGAAVRRLSHDDVRNILSVLEALTHLAIREIVERIELPGVREEIEKSLTQSREFKRRTEAQLPLKAYRDENVRFHNALYALAGNGMLADVRERLRVHILRLEWEGMINAGSGADWTAGHEETLIAILAADTGAAIAAKTKGLAKVRAAILVLPSLAQA